MNLCATLVQNLVNVLVILSTSFSLASISKMNTLRSRALRFCALDNLHDLSSIRAMIAPVDSIVYGKGIEDIMNGMKDFHEKYHDVFWTFKEVKEVEDSSVEIDFDRYWTMKTHGIDNTNSIYSSSAVEIIKFNNDGLIQSIVYKRLPSEPILFGHTYPESRQVLLEEARKTVVESNLLFP
jgi:hypothetical protein